MTEHLEPRPRLVSPTVSAKRFTQALYMAADELVPEVDGRRCDTDEEYGRALGERSKAIAAIVSTWTAATLDIPDPNEVVK